MNKHEVRVILRKDIKYWCARSRAGDYGIDKNRDVVIKLARSVLASTSEYDKIVIENPDGTIDFTLFRRDIRQKPISQFFQDSVP